jgi:hypothetical protein
MDLKTLIDSEPANAGRTDQEVLDWLNETESVWVDVSWASYAKWMAKNALSSDFEDEATNGTGAAKAGAQFALMIVNAGQDLPASDADVRSAMVAITAVSGAAETELVALTQEDQPRWQANGISRPKFGHVQLARAV